MANLQVIGAGLPRTGTTSLKGALELLLDGPCYHMVELHTRVEEHGLLWWQALEGDADALDTILDGWVAAVDWPSSVLWRSLAEQHPDALVTLSHRGDAATWWASVDATVWAAQRNTTEPMFDAFNAKMREAVGLGDDWDDEAVACAFYQAHYDDVVATINPERLLIWQPSDGWEPLCEALGVDVPSEPFFHRNDRAEFIRNSQAATATADAKSEADG